MKYPNINTDMHTNTHNIKVISCDEISDNGSTCFQEEHKTPVHVTTKVNHTGRFCSLVCRVCPFALLFNLPLCVNRFPFEKHQNCLPFSTRQLCWNLHKDIGNPYCISICSKYRFSSFCCSQINKYIFQQNKVRFFWGGWGGLSDLRGNLILGESFFSEIPFCLSAVKFLASFSSACLDFS